MHKDTILGFLRILSRFAKELRYHGGKAGVESFVYAPGDVMELRIKESVFDVVFDRFRIEMTKDGDVKKVYYLDGLKIVALKSKGVCDESVYDNQE